MKHIIIHFISFLLGVAVAAAGFTYVFPQMDPQQEQLEQSQPPPSQKGEPPQAGGHNHGGPGGENQNNGQGGDSRNRPNFTPQDMPSSNSKGAPPPGR